MRRMTEQDAFQTALDIIETLGDSPEFHVQTGAQVVAQTAIKDAILKAYEAGRKVGWDVEEGCQELAAEFANGYRRGVEGYGHTITEDEANLVARGRYDELMQS